MRGGKRRGEGGGGEERIVDSIELFPVNLSNANNYPFILIGFERRLVTSLTVASNEFLPGNRYLSIDAKDMFEVRRKVRRKRG